MEQPSTQPIAPSSTPASTTPHKSPNKSNKGLIVALVICIILAFAGLAFGIFSLISSNHKSSEIDGLKSLVAQKDETIASLKNPETPTTTPNDDDDNNNPAPQTNSYTLFSDNLSKNPANIFGYYYHYTGTENIQRTMLAALDNNHHLKITDLDNNDKLIAEADNILSIYFIRVGNGGTPYFYLIYQDGKVSRLCIAENADRTVEAIDGYTDIVSIFEGSDLFAYLIDINGNLYKTY